MMTTDWFSGAIIWRIVELELQFLVQKVETTMRQYRGQLPQTKFIGGRGKDHPEDKTPETTLCREVLEETDLQFKEGFIPELLHIPNPENNGHQKFFYLVPFDCLEGELRTKPKDDNSSYLHPPQWVKARGIVVYKTHKRAARAAVRRIMRRILVG